MDELKNNCEKKIKVDYIHVDQSSYICMKCHRSKEEILKEYNNTAHCDKCNLSNEQCECNLVRNLKAEIDSLRSELDYFHDTKVLRDELAQIYVNYAFSRGYMDKDLWKCAYQFADEGIKTRESK